MTIVTMPNQDTWIPDVDQLATTKKALMACVGGALDAFGRSEAYERRVIAHGAQVQPLPEVGQIILSLLGVLPGKAGQQQFQFTDGAFGKQAQRFSRWRILMLQPWESIEGGMAPSLPTPAKMLDQGEPLDRDGWIVYSALLAMALGGLVTDPPYAPLSQDNVLEAQMTTWGPQGQLAGYEYTVEIQL